MIHFPHIATELRVSNSDIRLFGKSESFVTRPIGVTLVFDADVERMDAKKAAGLLKSRAA